MAGPLSTRWKTLVSQATKDFNEFTAILVHDVKQKAAVARSEEQKRLLEQERLDSLCKTLEQLLRRKSDLELETQRLSTEQEEVAARCGVFEAEVNASKIESADLKEKKKNLVKEVTVLEMEKDMKVEQFIRRWESYSKYWEFYKNRLTIGIELEGADVFKVGFPKGDFLTLRSTDMKSWEIIHVKGAPNLKDELIKYLAQTGDIMGIVCRVRKAAVQKPKEPSSCVL